MVAERLVGQRLPYLLIIGIKWEFKNSETYRCIELNSILGDHSSNSLIGAVAAVVSRCHCTSVFTPYLL